MKKSLLVVGFIMFFTSFLFAQKDSVKTMKFVKILKNGNTREKKLVPNKDFIVITKNLHKTKIKFNYITIINSGFIYNRKDDSKKVIYNIGDTILFKDIKLVDGTTEGYILRNLISLPSVFIGGPTLAVEFIGSGLSMMNPIFMIPTAGVFVCGIVFSGVYKKFNTTHNWEIKSCYYYLR